MAEKKSRKVQVARTPDDKQNRKQLFLKELAEGCSPGVAARGAGIDRSTAYNWKNEDKEFSAKWDDAVEMGLDLLETAVFKRGLIEGGEDARSQLKYRRYGGGGSRTPHQQTNFILNVTMEEHFKRLERLGVPLPEIECDYEETDAEARTQRK
jgi:hypothetical protein